MTTPAPDATPGTAGPVPPPSMPNSDPMPDPVNMNPDETEPSTGPGGQDSVQGMLDVFMREQAEPRDGFEPVPFWVAIVCGGLLMWGGYYIGSNSADFRADVFDRTDLTLPAPVRLDIKEPDPQTVSELVKIGAQKYGAVCAACHQPDGSGKNDPNQRVPPLNGSEWVAGAQASPARLARIVLHGLEGPLTVKGQAYNAAMDPRSDWKDYEIASVITFIRNSWENKADPDDKNPTVSTAVVAAARSKTGKRGRMTAAELLQLPLDHSDLGPPAKK